MTVRRQVALATAILIGVALAAIPTATSTEVETVVVVVTTTDPPRPAVIVQDEKDGIVSRPVATTATTAPPPPPPTTTTTAAPVSRPVAPPSGDRFDALAQCESGGNPATNTGNGYYGAFQFDLQTWASTGRSGNPADHSYEEQKAAAIELQARRGWHPWPACSRELGYL